MVVHGFEMIILSPVSIFGEMLLWLSTQLWALKKLKVRMWSLDHVA